MYIQIQIWKCCLQIHLFYNILCIYFVLKLNISTKSRKKIYSFHHNNLWTPFKNRVKIEPDLQDTKSYQKLNQIISNKS